MYDEILAALEVRTKQLTNAPAIAYDNVKYDPKVGVPWIKSTFLPMERNNIFAGLDVDGKPYRQKYTGVYQLLLHYPESTGQKATNLMVNEIMDKFEATTDLSFNETFVTIKSVERIRGVNDGPWFITPVQISWYSYSK